MTDREATERFQALYERECRRVYAYAASRVGRQQADEVVSEVFLVAWRRLADVPVPPLPWLLVVARNVVNSQFRATSREQLIAAEVRAWVSETELTSPDVAEEVSGRIAALTALATLPEADREVLLLIAWHGLAPGEAARVLRCSTATYFMRLHRARRRLRRVMTVPEGTLPCPPRTLRAHGSAPAEQPGHTSAEGAIQ
ncbi:MAG TPA: sigma-70 family RNA polymerase sigma factor [Streptosporangiaceae bacterium]|nr:sigma-70 family RNA polymerase sigma factor [Streptosporangiaceae bacterium]